MSTAERFDRIAAQFPNKIAIKYESDKLTYSELQLKANTIAHHIKALGPDKGQVAFFLSFGIEQFVTLFGILKAGSAYVPIDTSWPAHRIEFSLADSESAAVITDNTNLGQVKALCGESKIINIDDIDFSENTAQPGSYPSADDIQHILYTSGSTGEPKGVYTSHRNQMHFLKRFTELIDISSDDIFAYYFSIGFSAHAMPTLGTLLNGGTLVMYNLKKNGFPGLDEFFNEEMITICLMIPSVLRHFRATLEPGFKIKKLRTLLIGGETLYFNDIKQTQPFLKRKTEIINIYASTELYLSCAYRITPDTYLKQNIIPIGQAMEGFEINIHNEDGKLCEKNQIGEMIIQSPYSALGYWKKPELTKIDFPDGEVRKFNSRDLAYMDEDGFIVHVGRKDSMVKIRGQRVDLGEVENTLLFSEDVQEVAAVMKQDPLGNKILVAYYVCSPGKNVELPEISNALNRRLPDFMIPKVILKLEKLPKNASGKTDYLSLPDPDWERGTGNEDIQGASNPIEKSLIELFEKHLEIYPIGVKDDILKAGHDSLKMFVAFDSIEKEFGIKLVLDDFMEEPTVESLAKIVTNLQNKQA